MTSKNAKNIVLGGVVGLLSLGTIASASAFHNAERFTAVKEAVQNKDYVAFVEATKNTKKSEVIDSEEKFDQLIEVHELREAGNREEAREKARELGLRGANGPHRHSKGHRNPSVKAALESNDWAAFQEATKDGKLGEMIDTQTEFTKLIEAMDLREAGDHDGAKDIHEELGLQGHREGHGKGHKKGERGEHGGHHRGADTDDSQ